MLQGIDVSTYQRQPDWGVVAQSGTVTFVYAKCTEGTNYVDDQYSRNKIVCAERGLPMGAYHFFHPGQDPIAQADHFALIASPRAGELVPMVDVEVSEGYDAAGMVKRLGAFVESVEHKIGRSMLIYASYAFWNGELGGTDGFSGHPRLWVAAYNSDPAPPIPNGWNDWVLWQWSDNGQIPGIIGAVDQDRFNGTDLKGITL